ncbi:MAG: thiaminase II [Pseudomonadota bacterium]
MTSFSQDAWTRVARVREAIYQMPFNVSLADGTLSEDVFAHYIVQDSLYLAEYAKTLALAAAKAPHGDALMTFSGGATVAVQVERALHEEYFRTFGIDAREAARAEPSPTCLGYTSYLLSVAQTQGFAELVAAILPCFWVYQDVGQRIHKAAAPDNPYRAWIDTYADEGFEKATRDVIDITDEAASSADAATVERMHTAFLRCTQFEWMFWDAAWRRETWPVTA